MIDDIRYCLDDIGRVWREGSDEWYVSTKSAKLVRGLLAAHKRKNSDESINYNQRKELSYKKNDQRAWKSKKTLKFLIIESS